MSAAYRVFATGHLESRGEISDPLHQAEGCTTHASHYHVIMTMTLNVPDALTPALRGSGKILSQVLQDGFAVEAYRQGILSAAEVGVLLGHASRWQTEDFLAAHDAWPGHTLEEVVEDGSRLREILGR
jgi:hypothetical protein